MQLASFGLLDTPNEAEFHTGIAIACRVLDCPIATVTLVDDHGDGAGYEVLGEVARRLRTPALGRLLSVRLGGDEFVLRVTQPPRCADLEKIIQIALEE